MNGSPVEPPLLAPPPARPANAMRLAAGLVIFGVLSFFVSIADLVHSFRTVRADGLGAVSLNSLLSCLVYWVAAWLVAKDRRFIYPVIAYFTAATVGAMLGSLAAGAALLPFKLVRAVAVHDPLLFWGNGAFYALTALFFVWLGRETRHVAWPADLTKSKRWLQPSAFFGYGAVSIGLLLAAVLALLDAGWTNEAINRAREKYGPAYDYRVLSYHMKRVNGRTTTHAVVLAYDDDSLRRVVLDWQD